MSEVGNNAGEHLKSIVSRIERLEEEKRSLAEDIKEIFIEAKSAGFDVKVLRRLVRERKMDRAELDEIKALLETYHRALGEFVDTPLGEAALAKVR